MPQPRPLPRRSEPIPDEASSPQPSLPIEHSPLATEAPAPAASPEEAWRACLAVIRENVSWQAYRTWFEPVRPLSLVGSKLTIQVPSRFFYEWIEEHHYATLRRAVVQVLGDRGELAYHVSETPAAVEAAPPRPVAAPPSPSPSAPAIASPGGPPPQQRHVGPGFTPMISIAAPQSGARKQGTVRAGTHLNPRFTFDNFITGESNQLAYAAARAVADRPGGTRFNPLVLYGGVGLGKTHLAQAIGHLILASNPNAQVVYTTSEQFTYEFVNAIQHNRLHDFTNSYRTVDVLIVDDIQFFAEKERTQDNFFHTFNALHQSGRQIVLTSDVPPKQLAGLDERLISRFQSGLTTDIQPPDLETRIAILQKMSADEHYQLPGEVIEYIARNVTASVRELEGCLITLLAECSLRNLTITLDLTREVVSGIATPSLSTITIEQIQQTVARQSGIALGLLSGKTRKHEIVVARQVAMYLIRELLGTSLKTIGNHFGGRDHTTVIHAVDSVATMLERDENTRRLVSSVRRELGLPATTA